MKIVVSALFMLFSLNTIAQETDSSRVVNKYSLGFSLTNISYHIYYKDPETDGEMPSGYFVPISFNFGYKLNKRISIQAGLAYGRDRSEKESSILLSPGNVVAYEFNSLTKVVAVPLTIRFILFGTYNKLPVYATTAIMPAFGTTKLITTETRNGIAKTTDVQDSGINTFFTAGLGLNFKIRKHFTGFTEILFLKSNLNGSNSKYYDWNYESPEFFKFIASLGLGVNFNFRPKKLQ